MSLAACRLSTWDTAVSGLLASRLTVVESKVQEISRR